MVFVVIKKDGREEAFIKEKIVVSAVKSGAPVELAREIADDVEKNAKEEIKTREIRERVLLRLKRKNPKWHDNWVSYDENVKRLCRYRG